MKKIHLSLLLAGLLAIGSAFTNAKKHKLNKFETPYYRTPNGFVKVSEASPNGHCDLSSGKCQWLDTNDDGTPDIEDPTSEDGIFQ